MGMKGELWNKARVTRNVRGAKNWKEGVEKRCGGRDAKSEELGVRRVRKCCEEKKKRAGVKKGGGGREAVEVGKGGEGLRGCCVGAWGWEGLNTHCYLNVNYNISRCRAPLPPDSLTWEPRRSQAASPASRPAAPSFVLFMTRRPPTPPPPCLAGRLVMPSFFAAYGISRMHSMCKANLYFISFCYNHIYR